MTLRELEETLKYLGKLEDDNKDDDFAWITKGLLNLYSICKKYNQFDIPREEDFVNTDFIETTKVVKLNTWIPDEDLKRSNWEYIFFMGMFAPVNGLFISKKLMDEYFNHKIERAGKRDGFMSSDDIKKLGLPEEFRPETIKQLGHGIGFGLLKGNINTFVRTWNNYDFLNLLEEDTIRRE